VRAVQHTDGVRYEFFLESADGAARALYRAVVAVPGADEKNVRVEITPGAASVIEGAEALDADQARQLVALAKTLGRRADDGPWPRRVNRWRKPGVR
jgi:hypothetical protein